MEVEIKLTPKFATTMPPVFRFAPSPNGYLHLGHALSAVVNADMAKAKDGRLLLRIEDIDQARCRPEFESAIYEDLEWIGLQWERPVRRQSEYWTDYRAALTQLEAMGLVYPSFRVALRLRDWLQIVKRRHHGRAIRTGRLFIPVTQRYSA